jgi:biotin operon repressor
MANEEIIGYHKGALATLSKERQELVKMIGIVDQFIKMHLEELKKLGIDLEAEAKKLQKSAKQGSQEYSEENRVG